MICDVQEDLNASEFLEPNYLKHVCLRILLSSLGQARGCGT